MQMDLFVRNDLTLLMQHQDKWLVSIFMPTHSVTTRVQEDQIRFKNLIKQAENRLIELEVDKPDSLLEPAYRLLDDHPFWRHRSDGLALFLAKNLFKPYRLPIRFDELVNVGNRFHIKPILPLLTGDGRFYLLALSRNQVRLFQCAKYSVNDIELEGVPASLDEALKYDEVEKQLQFRTRTAGGGPGRRPAMYHGHGARTDETKDRILRFFQEVDKGIQNLLSEDNIPMVIASVDYLAPIFKQATSYPHVLEANISGNPDDISAQDLHSKALEIITPYFERETEDRLDTYEELLGTDKTSSDVEEIVKAAFDGRVDVLFVPLGAQRWGKFNPANDQVRLLDANEPGAIDLLDFAAAQTLLNSGAVYALSPEEMPHNSTIAAVFRYGRASNLIRAAS
jgi:hypothetical protein